MVHSNYPVAKKGDFHETTALYIHRTKLTEECNYKDLTMVYGIMLANQCKSI